MTEVGVNRANLYKVTRGAILYKVKFVQWPMFLSHYRLLILVDFDLRLGFYIPSLLSSLLPIPIPNQQVDPGMTWHLLSCNLYFICGSLWLINWLVFYNQSIFLFMIACLSLFMDCLRLNNKLLLIVINIKNNFMFNNN